MFKLLNPLLAVLAGSMEALAVGPDWGKVGLPVVVVPEQHLVPGLGVQLAVARQVEHITYYLSPEQCSLKRHSFVIR